MSQIIHGKSLLTDSDIYLFKGGNHFRLYDKLGAHPMAIDGAAGTHFSVWAPNAQSVSVIGDFNGWNRVSHPLACRWDSSGIWEGFIPGLTHGQLYKYFIVSKQHDYSVEKQDPFAFCSNLPPQTASRIWDIQYDWHDQEWMQNRKRFNQLNGPISIYELHLGSWRRALQENNRFYTYRELARELVSYIQEMGYTHVEFMPIMADRKSVV